MFWAYCGGIIVEAVCFVNLMCWFLSENEVAKLVVTICGGLGSPSRLPPVVNTQMEMYTYVSLKAFDIAFFWRFPTSFGWFYTIHFVLRVYF